MNYSFGASVAGGFLLSLFLGLNATVAFGSIGLLFTQQPLYLLGPLTMVLSWIGVVVTREKKTSTEQLWTRDLNYAFKLALSFPGIVLIACSVVYITFLFNQKGTHGDRGAMAAAFAGEVLAIICLASLVFGLVSAYILRKMRSSLGVQMSV